MVKRPEHEIPVMSGSKRKISVCSIMADSQR
jgi:hypothetical protein